MSKEPKVHTHDFYFGKDKGGESLHLKIDYYHNGDDLESKNGVKQGIWADQKLTLNSYGNSASFNLHGTNFTSKDLRKLADELDAAEEIARQKAREILSDKASSLASHSARISNFVFDSAGNIIKNRYGPVPKNKPIPEKDKIISQSELEDLIKRWVSYVAADIENSVNKAKTDLGF